MKTAEQIAAAWAGWKGQMHTFAQRLDRDGVAYLSFSKVVSIEFCPQRYLLEYVKGVKLKPEPKYFIKGRLLHKAAARLHRARMHDRRAPLKRIAKSIEHHLDGEDANHVHNAVVLMHQQIKPEWQVVAVEEPFVLDLGPGLPPCIGIIDLTLQREDEFAVVDHKGGKRFYAPDRLQLVIYHEQTRRRYGAERCTAYFDQYRWVNNLDRIRKPAFMRTKVQIRDGTWGAVLRRLAVRHRQMTKIKETGEARGTGDCIICPFRNCCPKATFSYSNAWW